MRQALAAGTGSVGLVLLVAGIIRGTADIQRDGTDCGTAFQGVGHAAGAGNVADLTNDMLGQVGGNIQGACVSAVSDAHTLTWMLLGSAIVLIVVALALLAHILHFTRNTYRKGTGPHMNSTPRIPTVQASARDWERAGRIINELMYYRGLTSEALGARSSAISGPTIRRLLRGVEIGTSRLAVLDGLLDLPPGTIRMLVAGDAQGIAALPWRPEDSYVRDYLTSGLASDVPKQRRRKAN